MDLLYLIRSGLGIPDYWHPNLEIQTDFLTGKIGRYPVSMDVKAEYPGRLNQEGVPIVFLGNRPCVLPVTVALYGLGNHDVFLRSGEERYRKQMICALRWFQNHAVRLGDGVGWPNEQDVPVYGLNAPWFSGLAQALALSLLVRAQQLDLVGPWAELAGKTWRGYRVPVDEGGFCRAVGDGVIYEEYPGPKIDCVFNGMCFALIGLWEASKSGIVADAESDFRKGVGALRSLLPHFVHGRWSLYSLNACLGKPLLSSPYYQKVNGLLARIIGLMTGDAEFSACAERWLQSSHSLPLRVAMSLRIGMDRFLYAPTLLHRDKSRN